MPAVPPMAAVRLFLAGTALAASTLATAAGQESGSAMAWLQAAAPALSAEAPPESRLVGLVIDGEEVGSEIILWRADNFWLPYPALLDYLGVSARRKGGELRLTTPGGEVTLDPGALLNHHGELYISRDTLRDRLHIDIAFDSARYAVRMQLSWWSGSGARARQLPPREPDFRPPSFSVSQLRLDQHFTGGEQIETTYYTELTGAGRLASGVWRVELEKAEEFDLVPQEYFWVNAREQQQWLLGKQTTTAHPLLPGREFTGVQSAWSNRPFQQDYYEDLTRNDFTRSLGIGVKDISGRARPGSIAELLVDDQRAAVTRVRLDGSYDFSGVQLPGRQFNRVVVRIREPGSGTLLEEQDFSGVNSDLLLEGGRQVLYGGAGVRGNPLHPDYDGTDGAGLLQWRAGLSNRVTVEALYQELDETPYALAGLTTTLGERWLASGSVASADGGANAWQLETTGFGEQWQFRHLSREFEPAFRANPEREFTHEAELRHSVTDTWTWGVLGRRERSYERDIDFVLPGAHWRPTRSAAITAWPNYEGDYRIDFRTWTGAGGRFSYTWEDHRQEADYRTDLPGGITWFNAVRDEPSRSARFETGLQWLPDDGDERSRLAGSLIANEDGEMGYALQFDWLLLPGIFSRLEVRDEPEETGVYAQGFRAMWTLTADFSFTGFRPRPASSGRSFNRAGSISGRLVAADGMPARAGGVEQVTVLVDGHARRAVMEGDYFHLANLRPGTYNLRLDAESLPLEVVPEARTYVVEVGSGAVTDVRLQVQREYAAAGRVIDQSGTPVVDALIEVTGSDGFLRRVRSDRFGLYRVDGLAPGSYRAAVLSVDGVAPAGTAIRQLTVADDFLFDQDLVLTRRAAAP